MVAPKRRAQSEAIMVNRKDGERKNDELTVSLRNVVIVCAEQKE